MQELGLCPYLFLVVLQRGVLGEGKPCRGSLEQLQLLFIPLSAQFPEVTATLIEHPAHPTLIKPLLSLDLIS